MNELIPILEKKQKHTEPAPVVVVVVAYTPATAGEVGLSLWSPESVIL